MPIHVMVDLETLGTSNNAMILSIGAVKFDSDLGEIHDKFQVAIDPRTAERYNFKIDAGTVMWWLDPDRYNARVTMASYEKHDIGTALEGFQQWFGNESLPTWGNGATFDNVILRNAYTALNLPCPWEFWHDRCYRTMKNLAANVKVDREGTHHDALDDAVYQTEHLLKIATALKVRLS